MIRERNRDLPQFSSALPPWRQAVLCRSRLRAANRRKPNSGFLLGQVGRYQSGSKLRALQGAFGARNQIKSQFGSRPEAGEVLTPSSGFESRSRRSGCGGRDSGQRSRVDAVVAPGSDPPPAARVRDRRGQISVCPGENHIPRTVVEQRVCSAVGARLIKLSRELVARSIGKTELS